MGSKIIKTGSGSFELNTPRGLAGSFELQLIKKNQTQLIPEIDHKLLLLCSHGMSYRDMKYHIHDMYGIEVSTDTITAITDQLIAEMKEWQQRPLNSVYLIIWMDAIHYKVREEGCYISKAIYTLLGLTVDGEKEILGIYLSDTEGASF